MVATARRLRAARIALAAGAASAIAVSTCVVWMRSTLLDDEHMLGVLDDARAHAYLREHGLPSWLDARMRELGFDDPAHREFAGRVLRDVIAEDAIRARSAMVLVPKLELAAAALRREPLAMQLTERETRAIAHEIAPPTWVDGQVTGATYTVARWAVGAQRTFEIRIDYGDRVPLAAAAFERLLRTSGVEAVLLDRVVVPAAVEGLGHVEPFVERGVEPANVRAAIERLAPAGWLAAQVSAAIHAIGTWLSGGADVFELAIDTGALRDTAASVVGEVARETVGDELSEEMLEELTGTVRSLVPETTTWTETELRAAIGDDAHDQLRWLRATIVEGFRYDQNDIRRELREHVGLDDREIDAVRAVLGEGFVYTEVDLRAGRLGLPLEAVLSSLANAMAWSVLPFALALVLVVALALLSGPSGWRRARWTLGAIAAAGVLTLLVLAPIVRAVIDAHVLDWAPGAADSDAALAFAERLRSALGRSVDGLRWIGGALAVVAGAPLGGAWIFARRRRRPGAP